MTETNKCLIIGEVGIGFQPVVHIYLFKYSVEIQRANKMDFDHGKC